MAKEKIPNYSDAEVADMVSVYRETKSIDAVRQRVFTKDGVTRKSVAQVRAKLVSLGEYDSEKAKTEKVAKADNGPTKKELLRQAHELGIDVKGLEGASKDGLHTVIEIKTRLNELEASADGEAVAA